MSFETICNRPDECGDLMIEVGACEGQDCKGDLIYSFDTHDMQPVPCEHSDCGDFIRGDYLYKNILAYQS
jgi:hypothetical protein